VALLDATDPDGLAAAMDGVFTACSLTGSLWSRPEADPSAAVVEPARVFLAAAKAAGVRRVVVCSPAAVATPGAAGNAHLTAKAEVERMVAASGLEHAILRCAHVLGPGGRLLGLLAAGAAGPGQPSGAPGREPVLVPGDGRQRVAPVWVGDVADAIATADDAAELSAVTWSLAGPTQLTFDELVDAVHGSRVAKRHLGTGDGAAGGVAPARGAWAGLRDVQVGVLAADSLGDPALPAPPGLVTAPLAETLARAAGRERAGLPGRLDG
jgi:NADH dehydrogenase